MSVTIWGWETGDTGHVALETSDAYLSFHPAENDKVLSKAKLLANTSYKGKCVEFINDLGGSPGAKFKVVVHNNLDEDAVEAAILSYKENPPNYTLYNLNCSFVVASALLAGVNVLASRSVFQGVVDDFKTIFPQPVKGSDILDGIADLASSLGPTLLLPRVPQPAKKAVVALAAGLMGLAGIHHTFYWTPAAVARLGKDIEEM